MRGENVCDCGGCQKQPQPSDEPTDDHRKLSKTNMTKDAQNCTNKIDNDKNAKDNNTVDETTNRNKTDVASENKPTTLKVSNRAKILKSSPTSMRSNSERRNEEDTCPICLDTIGGSSPEVPLRECGHAFCRRCLECYIKVCLSAALRPICECPEANCRTPIHPNDYPLILTNPMDLAAWERSQVRSAIPPGQRRHRLVSCPTPGCPNMILFRPSSTRLFTSRATTARRCAMRALQANPGRADHSEDAEEDAKPSLLLNADEVVCDACHVCFCAKCGLRAHNDGEVCPEAITRRVQRWVPNHRPSLGPNSRYCPTCSTPVTKEGGCNIVHCPVCRCYFCWFCGQKDDRGPNGSNCLAHWTAFCKLRGDRITGRLNASTVKNPLLKLIVALIALIGGVAALPLMVTWALCVVFPYNFFWDCYFSTPHDVTKKIINAFAAIMFLFVCCISMPIMWAALYACCWGDIFGFIWHLFRAPTAGHRIDPDQLSPSILMRSTSISINNTELGNLRNTQLTTPDSDFEGSVV